MNVYANTDQKRIEKWGAKLRGLHLEANLSQSDLAELTDTSSSSVAAMEEGRNFSVGSLIAILRALKKPEELNPYFTPSIPKLSPMEIHEREKIKYKRRGYRKRCWSLN